MGFMNANMFLTVNSTDLTSLKIKQWAKINCYVKENVPDMPYSLRTLAKFLQVQVQDVG